MSMSSEQLQNIIEAALMVAGQPLPVTRLLTLFTETERPQPDQIQHVLISLQEKYRPTGIELREVASGYQFQAKIQLKEWLSRLWEDRPSRYSRAVMETLALIAYRQPITRAEVEAVRGVSVSSYITKSLLERGWIRIVSHRDVPGKPALYGTTQTFLDHFNLKNLSDLPTLAELKDLDLQEANLQTELDLTTSRVHDHSITLAALNYPTIASLKQTTADNADAHISILVSENATEMSEPKETHGILQTDEIRYD